MICLNSASLQPRTINCLSLMAKLLEDCFVHPLTRNEKMLMKTMIWCLVCIARVTTQYTQLPDPPGLRSKSSAEGDDGRVRCSVWSENMRADTARTRVPHCLPL